MVTVIKMVVEEMWAAGARDREVKGRVWMQMGAQSRPPSAQEAEARAAGARQRGEERDWKRETEDWPTSATPDTHLNRCTC